VGTKSEGFSNHLWDINRLLGKDENAVDADIHPDWLNRLSFIASGPTCNGPDIYEQLDELLAAGLMPS
jgi:hypothetical protein